MRSAHLRKQGLVDLWGRHRALLLADLIGQLALQRTKLLDLRVGDVERVENLHLGDLVGARLHHQDRVFGAGHDQVEVGALQQILLARIDDEVTVDLADPHRADRASERYVGDHQGGGGAVHRQDVVRMDVVDGDRNRHQLRLVVPALGE